MPMTAPSTPARKLLLMSGNRVRQNHPLLVVRTEQGKDAALSAIDSTQLSFMLSMSGKSSALYLQVGSAWLNESGRYLSEAPTLHRGISQVLTSSHYPFTILAGYAMPVYWKSLWAARHVALSWLAVSSLLLAWLVWWVLGRPGSPTDELRRALRAREFVPYLQPLIASHDGKMMGAEVLMRWEHVNEGVIRPDLFIPQAEESGLIVPMTTHIMKQVATRLNRSQEQLPDGFHISFNISAAHCHDFALLAECRAFLGHFVPGKVVLVLELTERELLMSDPRPSPCSASWTRWGSNSPSTTLVPATPAWLTCSSSMWITSRSTNPLLPASVPSRSRNISWTT